MTDGVKITLTGHESLIAKLKGAPDTLVSKLKTDLVDFAVDLREMAATRAGSRTGRLAASIQASIMSPRDNTVSVLLQSQGVPYAAIQERGGTIQPRQIIPAKGKALAFSFAKGGAFLGDTSFYASVNWPGATIKPKRFIEGTLKANRARFMSICQQAMTETLNQS